MVPQNPTSAYPGSSIQDETDRPAQQTAQRGPGAVQVTSHDSRTELDRLSAQREAPRDPDADTPKVEPVPEVPGLFLFTTPVLSSKAQGGRLDRVTLRPATARTLILNGAFMKTVRRTFRDEATRAMVSEETTSIDFAILAKHVADMSGLPVMEVEGISGYDMMRMSLKVQEMMYSLPPTLSSMPWRALCSERTWGARKSRT